MTHPMNERREHCGECRFAIEPLHGPGELSCARFPPQMHALKDESGDRALCSTYPIVMPSQWCGEFKPQVYEKPEGGN